jgi:quercetin dioxygenase-like cupin family protein
MKLIKTFYLITMITLFSSQWLMAQPEIFPKGEKAPNVHHTGDVWLNHLAEADENFDFNVVQATMAAGSKLNWHLHPKGQQLYITDGVGYYQEKGKEVQVVKQGDVIKCEPEIEHWHAATPNTPVTYIAISGNAPTTWTDTITAETYNAIKAPELSNSDIEKEIKELSKKKWDWMADKKADTLADLFHDKSKFVHMGGSWGKDREVEVIRSGDIHYKNAEIDEVSVDVMGNTAILLNHITLLAVVGGNEVTNPFIVTEVYKKENGDWKLANMSFVRQMTRD